jgi:hypothetical protein
MTDSPDTPAADVTTAARAAALDLPALVERVDRVLAEPLYWYPVRHHSPAIARQLAVCIRKRLPKIIFIEGPFEAQHLIEFVVDSKTKPPVAIYSSFRDDAVTPMTLVPSPATPGNSPPAQQPPAQPPRHSAWYPIVSYSPEYVAMSLAKELGAEAVFIDLPHYASLGRSQAPARRDLEGIAPQSSFFQKLTDAAGHRTFDETWDALFEGFRPSQTYEQLRRDVAMFCAAVRATTPGDSLRQDETLSRERFMMQTIRNTLAAKNVRPEDAMVVCGGFHIFLDRDDPVPPPPIPTGTLSVTVAPYSYFRLSQLAGYGAGNRAPRFYELCFEHHSAGVAQDQVVIDHVIDVLKHARKRGEPLSSADAIGVTQAAMMLSRLRGRAEPVLDDLHDALITCCCKGNPKSDATHLLEAMDEVNIGTRLGRVTERVGRLPIINDFYEQLEKLELDEIASREKLYSYALDKREPRDASRSALLHRLVFLGVEIGQVQREASAFGQSIFKEHWKLRWNPKIEAQLMERSLHGDTVETAAATVLRESLGTASSDAGPACRSLVKAVEMDLPQLVADAEQNCGHAIDHDERFASLADGLTSLTLLERYAAFRGLDRQRLADLVARCFDRACFAVPEVASAPPEQWDEVVAGLLALAEPLVQREDLDSDLFAAHVQQAAVVSTVPFIRGAMLGMLTEIRRMKPEALATELTAYARGSAEQQALAGDFLHGVLRVSRTAVLLGATSLVNAVDELLRVVDRDTFLGMVPRLRAAFETLHERQKDNIASHVAELYGLKESESLRTLHTTVGAARLMAELDSEVAAIMEQWIDG